MRKLFFIPFIISIGIGFYSCNVGGGGNIETSWPAPAVVDFRIDMGGTVICTPWGNYAAPSLTGINYPEDCIFIQEFTLDHDNQPSTNYLTATSIIKEDVEQRPLEQHNSIELEDYTLPISGADGFTCTNFYGKFFTYANCKDKAPSFRLVYKYDEEEIDGTKNFYLLAKPSSPNSSDFVTWYAFDMRYLVYSQGRDSTIIESGVQHNYKYIKANLYYLSGVSGDEPEYKCVNELEKPFLISIFND